MITGDHQDISLLSSVSQNPPSHPSKSSLPLARTSISLRCPYGISKSTRLTKQSLEIRFCYFRCLSHYVVIIFESKVFAIPFPPKVSLVSPPLSLTYPRSSSSSMVPRAVPERHGVFVLRKRSFPIARHSDHCPLVISCSLFMAIIATPSGMMSS